MCFDSYSLTIAEINIIAFQKLFGKSSKLTYRQDVENDKTPTIFVVKTGRCIQHVF